MVGAPEERSHEIQTPADNLGTLRGRTALRSELIPNPIDSKSQQLTDTADRHRDTCVDSGVVLRRKIVRRNCGARGHSPREDIVTL